MGDQVCEIEEIEEAAMATVQEHGEVNYNPPDFSDGGPHITTGDISPTLGYFPYLTNFLTCSCSIVESSGSFIYLYYFLRLAVLVVSC
jgi:hypothetical protein